MDRAALNDSPDAHYAASSENGPAATDSIVDPRDKRERADSTEAVDRRNDALETTFRVSKVYRSRQLHLRR